MFDIHIMYIKICSVWLLRQEWLVPFRGLSYDKAWACRPRSPLVCSTVHSSPTITSFLHPFINSTLTVSTRTHELMHMHNPFSSYVSTARWYICLLSNRIFGKVSHSAAKWTFSPFITTKRGAKRLIKR